MTTPQRAYRISDAAQQLSLSRSKVYQLIADGALPTFKIGRSRLVSAGALDELMRRLESGELIVR